MRSSLRIFLAASVTVAGMSVAGCRNDDDVPVQSAPGGILSGNEFQRNRSSRGTSLDTSGSASSSQYNVSHQTAGAGGTAGTVAGTPTSGSPGATGTMAMPAAGGAGAAAGTS